MFNKSMIVMMTLTIGGAPKCGDATITWSFL